MAIEHVTSIIKAHLGVQIVSLLLVICALAMVFFAYKRLFNSNKNRFFAVILLNVATSVLLLVLIISGYTPTKYEQFILLTDGAEINTISARVENTPLFVIDDQALEQFKEFHPTKLTSIEEFAYLADKNNVSTITVVGEGLTPSQWSSLAGYKVKFILSQPEKLTFGESSWPSQVNVGEPIVFTTTLQQRAPTTNGIFIIEIKDINHANIVSKIVKSNEAIKLSWQAKTSGLMNYQLSVRDAESDDAIIEQTLAVNVIVPKPLSVLVVSDAPNFESRQLKNWLTDNNSQAVMLNKISKDKWRAQQLNIDSDSFYMPSLSWQQESIAHELWLTERFVEQFDVVIMQGAVYSQLSTQNKTSLTELINDGLDVILLADDMLYQFHKKHSEKAISDFSLIQYNTAGLGRTEQKVRWPHGETEQSLPNSIFIIGDVQLNPLITNELKQSLMAKKTIGLGSVTMLTMHNSYRLKISGESLSYTRLWQYILSRAATKNTTFNWLVSANGADQILANDQQICFLNNDTEASVIFGQVITPSKEAINLSFSRHPAQYGKYCTLYVTDDSGWHQVRVFDSQSDKELPSLFFYHYNERDWLSLQPTLKAQHLPANVVKISSLADFPRQTDINNHQFVLWLLLLVGLTFLWLERKLY